VSDYVAEFGCGLVVEPRSGQAIGRALASLLSDRALWLSFAERCPAMAARFSSERVAGELLELYRPWVDVREQRTENREQRTKNGAPSEPTRK
jgi:glycosyltransferase involved in cell wall biosynthesis